MPELFDKCVKDGGRVRTINIKDHPDQYMRVCYKDGKSYPGEVSTKKKGSEIPHSFRGSTTDLATLDVDQQAKRTSIIEVMRVGKWDHPIYGEFEITSERLERFVQNFNDGVRKAVAIDIEHKSDEGAVGWVKRVFVEEKNGVYVLMAEIEWTDDGISLIRGKKYRFFSPEFADEYEDASSGEVYRDVLIGGAITNRPFFQELEEIVLSERSLVKSKKLSEKGGEKLMDLEKVLEILRKEPEHKFEESDEVSEEILAEAKAKLEEESKDDDSEDPAEDDKDSGSEEGKEGGEEDDTIEASLKIKAKKMNDGSVALSENQLEKLTKAANEGVKALREIRRMKLSEKVDSFVYSETNKSGVLLPKSKNDVLRFAESLGDKQLQTFCEILKSLPKIKMFGEIGSDHQESEDVIPENVVASEHKLMMRAKKLMSENPDKYKNFRDAAFEAEKQLKSEGVEFE
jgi:phage I-like protein